MVVFELLGGVFGLDGLSVLQYISWWQVRPWAFGLLAYVFDDGHLKGFEDFL